MTTNKLKVKRYFTTLLMACLFLGCKTTTQETTAKSLDSEKPNIIIFFTDDQGYADVGCYGAEGFKTPHLDNLANDGIKFTNFYVPANVCTPSRAALLTGKYPAKLGLHKAVIFPYSKNGLAPNEITLAEMLKTKGYATSCIGKWHLGHDNEKFMPNNQGFDEFYGVPYSNDMDSYYYAHNDYQSPPLPFYRNKTMIGEGLDQRYLTKMYTEEAVKQIKDRDKEKPFFMYLAHNMPHTPLFVSENFEGKSEKGLYGDVIMELDWSMGEIVKTLKSEGIYNNTVIVFTSDNGPALGSAKPLRGKKAQTWEGGHRVPGIVVWPNTIPKAKECDQMVTTMDLFPTFDKWTGEGKTVVTGLDGEDISGLLKNPESVKLEERPLFFYARDGDLEAVRLGKWKLHAAKSRGWNAETDGPFALSLYNLETDIAESENVASDNQQIVDKLMGLLKKQE